MAAAEAAEAACADWQSRHAEWLWCDDFEVDRLASYFEYDHRHGRFVREAGAGVGRSIGMRAEYLPGDPHGGFLHLAFGKTPSAYMKPVDAGTARYRDIYWRFRSAASTRLDRRRGRQADQSHHPRPAIDLRRPPSAIYGAGACPAPTPNGCISILPPEPMNVATCAPLRTMTFHACDGSDQPAAELPCSRRTMSAGGFALRSI